MQGLYCLERMPKTYGKCFLQWEGLTIGFRDQQDIALRLSFEFNTTHVMGKIVELKWAGRSNLSKLISSRAIEADRIHLLVAKRYFCYDEIGDFEVAENFEIAPEKFAREIERAENEHDIEIWITDTY